MAGTLSVAAACMIIFNEYLRAVEARAAAWLYSQLLDETTAAVRTALLVNFNNMKIVGVDVTQSCSSSLLVPPFLLMAAAVLLSARRTAREVLGGLLLAAGIVALGNIIRLVAIALVTVHYGKQGYLWSHTLGGSALSMVTMVLALGAFLRYGVRGGKLERRMVPVPAQGGPA
ncbi:exosortase/archaeosortase family protein [Kitasatospora sp. MMS16-BH015]|uniref:exosortase/archaeosortase family protein n=1 Tax=Kitasatospora sp. MMS16-BH015 TaxID=2018025 RepID=UPI00131A4E3C|nr:exosortase/archaeosortase family protein [Kitasatospora sp. MMS16-BH015]